MQRLRLVVPLLGMAVFAAVPLHAQVSAAISGKVEDASGSAVNGAAVTVKSLETGAARTVVTDDRGNFRALSLPLGPQEVKAEKPGFKTVVRTGINLEVGQEAVVNLQLEVGDLAQQVTVSEEAPRGQHHHRRPVSGMVGESEVKDLPLNGRSFDNLITLNPGAINYSAMKSANTSTSNGNTFSVAGRRTCGQSVPAERHRIHRLQPARRSRPAASAASCWASTPSANSTCSPTPTAPNTASAPARRSAWSRSPAPTSLHGTLFEFLRNSALDARNFFDQGFGSALPPKPVRRRAGRSAQERQVVPVRQLRRLPPGAGAEQRQRGPRRTRRARALLPNAAGVHTPVANLNPAMLPYMSVLARRQRPGTARRTASPAARRSPTTIPAKPSARISAPLRADYTLGDRDSLSGRLHHRRRQQPDPAGRSAVRRPTPRCARRWPACRRRTSSRPTC